MARIAIITMLMTLPPKLMNIWFFRLGAAWISPACSWAYPTHPRLVNATGVTRTVAAIVIVRAGVKPFAAAFSMIAWYAPDPPPRIKADARSYLEMNVEVDVVRKRPTLW